MNEKSKFFAIFVLMVGLMMFLPSIGEVSWSESEIHEENEYIDGSNIPKMRGTRGSSPKTVLAELFTEWDCGPCAVANPAMNELLDVYDRTELVMIGYHVWWPVTPPYDPFYQYNTADVQARSAYYGDIPWVPYLLVNGPPEVTPVSYSSYKSAIQSELAILSPMTISVEGELDTVLDIGTVTATIEITDPLTAGDYKVRFAVVEDNKYAMGLNNEPRHRYVMRDMLAEDTLPALNDGDKYTVSRAFPLDPLFDLDTISIVVFVQNDNNNEVLQAATYDYIPQKILVVDDDESSNPDGYEDDYHELLSLMGYSFDGWVYNERGSLTASDLENYEAVIWLTGTTTSNTLTAADRTAIADYFDNSRGGLFLNGEDIGADIQSESFLWDYLHAFYNIDTTADTDITGITSDPISDPYFAQNLAITGSSPSVIDPWTNASTVFYYSPSFTSAAIKAGHDLDSRVVYFPFLYFEGSDPISNKQDIMERVLNWLVVKVDYMQIQDGPNGAGSAVTDLSLNVGQSQTLWAAAYNHTYGFLKNYPITTWNDDSAGSLVTITTPGDSTLITAGMAGGSSTLTVNYFGVTNTTTITVNPPEPDYITLTDSPDGTEIADFSMLASENILIYASSYNLTSGYLGLVDVDWSDSGGLGVFDNSTGTSTTFTAGIVGGVSTISGDYIAYGIGDSVDITVMDAEVDYIQIRDSVGGLGSEILSLFLKVGESKQLWCAAYNDSAGYLGDHDSTVWSEDSSGSLITFSGSGETITVSALLVGGSTTLHADVNGVLTSAAIMVLEPTIDYIQINYQFGVSGTPVIDPIYPVGEEMDFFGAAYNLTSNYLYTVSSSSIWTSSNPALVQVSSPGSGSTITISDTLYGTSTLTLDDGLGHSYQTTITVIEPTIDFIRIRSEANGAGDIISSPTYDVGYEVMYYSACYNNTASYLGDLAVTWLSSDTNLGNLTPSGGSAQFKALDIGVCDVTVNLGSVQLVLTVTVSDMTDPTADAGAGGNINEGVTFGFDASGSSDNGRIVEYFWDFGGGDTESASTPTFGHIFASPGIYTITLTVTDSGGNTDSDQVTVTVWDVSAPTAQAVIPENADEDIPCFFDASASSDNVGIIEYKWEFGDGNSYEGEYKNVSHTYQMPGTYTVKLTVKDAAGYEAFITSEVTVSDATAPATPKGITVNPQVDGTSLKITWDAVTDSDLKHYELYVSEGNGEFTLLKTIAKGTTTYTHPSLLMENSYRYYLVAVDTSDNPSFDSVIVEGYPDIDTDSDGVFDRTDEDDDGDGLSDFREVEEATDPKNPDSDGDKHEDGVDAFPLNKKEWKDSDFDGVGDSADAFPKDASEWKDSDGDGVGDKKDFLPIHNLLFLIIMAIVIVAVLVGAMMMVKRKKAASFTFDGEETKTPETTSIPSEPGQEKPEPKESKEIPPPKKNLPPPPKKM